MHETWLPALVMMAGLSAGALLPAYAGWMIRCRRPNEAGEFPHVARMAASLINGLGWLAAVAAGVSAIDKVFLGAAVSAAVVFTLIDGKVRLIPNELVAALLALTAALALMDRGLAGLIGRLVGLLVALTLFLVAMWIAGPGKVGGGDVKLGAAVGFAAGFPGALIALLAMALAAGLAGGAAILLKRMGRTTPMPFAGFLMAGLLTALLLDRAGALGFLGWG